MLRAEAFEESHVFRMSHAMSGFVWMTLGLGIVRLSVQVQYSYDLYAIEIDRKSVV